MLFLAIMGANGEAESGLIVLQGPNGHKCSLSVTAEGHMTSNCTFIAPNSSLPTSSSPSLTPSASPSTSSPLPPPSPPSPSPPSPPPADPSCYQITNAVSSSHMSIAELVLFSDSACSSRISLQAASKSASSTYPTDGGGSYAVSGAFNQQDLDIGVTPTTQEPGSNGGSAGLWLSNIGDSLSVNGAWLRVEFSQPTAVRCAIAWSPNGFNPPNWQTDQFQMQSCNGGTIVDLGAPSDAGCCSPLARTMILP